MPPDSVWSDQFNKPEVKLNLIGLGWKNLMSNCLTQTEISKGIENKTGGCVGFDPNIVMNVRHKMIKEFPKAFPTPRGQTQSAAFKLLREEYHDKLLRHKEEKLVDTEITKLRQILENHRLVIKKKLEQTYQKAKVPPNKARVIKPPKKLPKGTESCDAIRRMDAWLGCSRQMCQQEISGKHKSVKSHHQTEEIWDFAPSRKGSLINEEDEQENEVWKEDEGKFEILRRFLENGTGSLTKSRVDIKEEVKVDQAKEGNNRKNQKGIGHALRKWKNCTECKTSITENKIESFLSRLREKKVKQEKRVVARADGQMRRKIWEKKEKDEQTEEKLKKLMQEVKSSQKEAQEKLREGRTSVKTDDNFLLRMEERRNERMKCRRAFEERKLKLEEEKENMQQQREEERKQRDEQEKRKKLEELKEKRRADKEKKEAQKQEREKLKVNLGLAVAHHRVYLLQNYGLRPWVKLMRMREWQQQEAVRFFERRVKERALDRWIASVKEQTDLKVMQAAMFYEGLLKKNCLTMWMETYMERLRQNQVAVDWYDLKIIETSFKIWLQFTEAERREGQIRSNLATEHHQRKLKQKYLQRLRDYPVAKRLEQDKENRKWKWRQKVKEILPDYDPVHVSENL